MKVEKNEWVQAKSKRKSEEKNDEENRRKYNLEGPLGVPRWGYPPNPTNVIWINEGLYHICDLNPSPLVQGWAMDGSPWWKPHIIWKVKNWNNEGLYRLRTEPLTMSGNPTFLIKSKNLN